MEKREILELLIEQFCKGNKAQFASKIGVKPQTINTWINRNTFDIDLIYSKCELVSADWLLTGKGEMLKSDSDIHNDSGIYKNNVLADGGSNVTMNNEQSINVALPESGEQKIIRPDGTVEIVSINDKNSEYFELLKKKDEQIDRLISIIEKINH